jgi:molybdopterin molybdotransferase
MLRMIDPDLALEMVLERTTAARVEELPLAGAGGKVLAESVLADRDYPPFDRAMMDGYAVRVEDASRRVDLVGEVAAGRSHGEALAPGRCVAIMTGAPCPEGANAVVPVEQVERGERTVLLPARLRPGQHIVPRGSERARGEPVAREGVRLDPLAVAALASVGQVRVRVRVPPAVAVIVTGDEVVDAAERPGQAQIRNSNGPMLAAAIERLGLPPPLLLHALDTAESLARSVADADTEVVLLSGGVSAGRYDLVPAALARAGVEVVFHKVTQKPGKPLLFGVRGAQRFFALPGNPLSSYFCFHRYVAASLRRALGLPDGAPAHGVLGGPVAASSERTLFLPARIEPANGDWRVWPLAVGSANIFACVEARGFVRLAPVEHRLAGGEPVDFDWM